MTARHAPATLRNRDPILAVLTRVLPSRGIVLEIASGTGEHAAYFAPKLAPRVWQPSDPDALNRASIAAHCMGSGARAPLDIDATAASWAVWEPPAAIVCINMIHIAPWAAAEGLFRGAAQVLTQPDAPLILYGPFMVDGAHTAPSNAAFDESLRARNPDWGVRDLDAVTDLAAASGFYPDERVEMPANNLMVIYRREG